MVLDVARMLVTLNKLIDIDESIWLFGGSPAEVIMMQENIEECKTDILYRCKECVEVILLISTLMRGGAGISRLRARRTTMRGS